MRVASMFSGIGGIDVGFQQAGFDIVWANEIDGDACNTYRNNFADEYIVEGDIRKINPTSIPDIDILAAGFPCQSFSIAGYQRGFNDARGNLFFEISKILDIKRPKIVFLENVQNLVEHDNGKTFLVIYNTLVQFGYYVKYKVMNAKDYANIPQNRDRIYIVAFQSLDECSKFCFPDEVELTTKVFDIIDRNSVKHKFYYYNESSQYYNDLINIVRDENAIYKINDNGVVRRRFFVCPTLTANMGTYPDRIPIIKCESGIRKLIPSECLALQGFPQEYTFPKTIAVESAYKQVGNSVCVPVVKLIAEKISNLFK